MKFPVLCIPRDLGVFVAASRDALDTCSAALFWRAALYAGMRLVDSDGNAYMVSRCVVSTPRTRLGQVLARFFDTRLKVAVDFAPIAPIPIQSVAAVVHAAIATDPEAFEELSGQSVSWWHDTLANAQTVGEVIRALCGVSRDGRIGDASPHLRAS